MTSKRPRRNVTNRISHLEGPREGVEGFSFSQLKEMKHGVLLQKFSHLESTTKTLCCRFPTSCKCTFETAHSEWKSLLAHLLQHRQECIRKGKKNPRFFETMTFHSVPKQNQPPFTYFDEDGNTKSTKHSQDDEDHLPLILAALSLRRRDPNKTKTTTYGDPYNSWKRYCHLAASDRIESVEHSPEGKSRNRSNSPARSFSIGSARSQSIDSHRRVSIFNPMTKESRPSVIQLSPAEPLPKPTSTDAELVPEEVSVLRTNRPNISLRLKAEPNPNAWRETLHSIRYPNDVDIDVFHESRVEKEPPVESSVSRVSVIRSNPRIVEKPKKKDPIDIDPVLMEKDIRILNCIKKIFDRNQNLEDDEELITTQKTAQKRPIQEVAENSITRRLQPVQPDSIFTIEQTFGTRRNSRRVSDVFGYGAGTDNDLEAALKASLDEANSNDISSPANLNLNTSGGKPRKIRRSHAPRKSGGHIMTEVST